MKWPGDANDAQLSDCSGFPYFGPLKAPVHGNPSVMSDRNSSLRAMMNGCAISDVSNTNMIRWVSDRVTEKALSRINKAVEELQ